MKSDKLPQENQERSYVVVGRVRRPHGIHGELRVDILTDYPERLRRHEYFYLAYPDTPDVVQRYTVESMRPHQGLMLLKLVGCETRDEAELMRDMLVEIPLEDAVPLEEGEYYHFQLIGMRVETKEGQWLGRVAQVVEAGVHDVYVVRGPRGEILVPGVSHVVLKLDVEAQEMVVDLPAGLLKEHQK